MKFGILAVAAMCLAISSCEKSGDPEEKMLTDKEIVTTLPVTEHDTPAMEEPSASNATTVAAAEAETTEVAAEQQASVVDGEAVYRKSCASCHMTGAAGAPRTGDAAAWSARISRGLDELVQSAISGVPGTAMMARGACHACTDDEIEAAVRYMTEQSQ
jgi:cytochrome c5